MRKPRESEIKKRTKVSHYIDFELEYLKDWSVSDPHIFMNYVIENGWHKRVCTRGEDLEKFRFIRRWMQKKENPTIFAEDIQLKLL